MGLGGFPVASSRRVYSLGSRWVWPSAAWGWCCNDAGRGRVRNLLSGQCLPCLLCPHHLVPRSVAGRQGQTVAQPTINDNTCSPSDIGRSSLRVCSTDWEGTCHWVVFV